MADLPQFLYLLVDRPTLIVVPIILFAAFALWSHSRTAWVATIAWDMYLVYELGMKAGEFCGGNACLRRTPLYVAYPLLAILSLLALVQGYVRIRDRRQRMRLTAIVPPAPQGADSSPFRGSMNGDGAMAADSRPPSRVGGLPSVGPKS